MKDALIKALLEMGRLIVLAVIPVAIPMVEAAKIDWKLILIVAVVTLLRGIDKYLHELAPEGEAGGLVRF